MPSVFKDPSLQKEFDQKGYVLLSSLLNAEQVDRLSGLFAKFQAEAEGAFHTSHFSKDVTYKKQVHDAIVGEVFPKAAPYLNNFQPLFGNFMVKNADPEFAMDLHADWTYVNEPELCSVAIWVPLVDVNEENGCLGIIEGSHKLINPIRGPLIRQSARKYDRQWENRYGKLLPMKKGDAIIYHHGLLHYSPPNKTQTVRPALNLTLAPASVPLVHYCMPEGSNEIEMYEVPDSNFYIQYVHFQRPQTGKPIKTLPKDSVKYIDSQMQSFWKTRLLSRIKQLF